MPDYTEKDLRALEDLMNFDGHASAAPAEGGQVASPVDYSRTDIDQFDQLMNFGTSTRQAKPAMPPESAADTGRDRYSDSDLRMFDRLLPPAYGNVTSTPVEKFGEDSVAQDSGGRSYSTQDQESFRQLMRFPPGNAVEPAVAAIPLPQPSYVQPKFREVPARAVTMKIVDTDKEYERERRNFLSGQAAIKIVFSDTS